MTHWKSWWAKAASIDRRWVVGSVVALGLVTLTWLFYASSRDVLERHIAGLTDLQYAGMGQKADLPQSTRLPRLMHSTVFIR